MNTAFFFEIQQIPDPATIFDEFKEQEFCFSYFLVEQADKQVDPKYYLFFYRQNTQESTDISFLYKSVNVIQELDSKKRKIRSLRGFFLYAQEIMEAGKDVQILTTNLQPFFWRKIRNVMRQNKKEILIQFIFGTQCHKTVLIPDTTDAEKKFKSLKEKVEKLQKRVDDLETNADNIKCTCKGNLNESECIKPTPQGVCTIKNDMGSYLLENSEMVHPEVIGSDKVKVYILPEAPKNLLNQMPYTLDGSRVHYKAQKEPNFVTLGNIDEQDKIEIVKQGFELSQQGKISLKKYYESTDQNSLFQAKGYQIKYDTIRKNKLYLRLKTSNN